MAAVAQNKASVWLDAAAEQVGGVLNALWWFLAPLMIAAFLVRGLGNAAQWLHERAAPVMALVFIVTCGLFWLVLVFAIKPEHFKDRASRIHRPLATGVISAAALAWVYIFALLSFTLAKLGLVSYAFRGAPGTELPDLCDAYAWYFLDLIPALHVNDALGWEADVSLEGGWRGIILLAFRVLIIYQLFTLARGLFARQVTVVQPVSRFRRVRSARR